MRREQIALMQQQSHNKENARKEKSMDTLVIKVREDGVEKFISLLQSGIEIESSTNASILDTIQKIKGFTTEYIDDEVQTIFLDGTAIDDVTAPLEPQTQVIALSAAMPGLSGAIYRKNSIHAALRSVQQNTQHSDKDAVPVQVKIKLFNAIARDRGLEILQQGVTLQAKQIGDFFRSREWLDTYISSVRLDNEDIPSLSLPERLSSKQKIYLQVLHDTAQA